MLKNTRSYSYPFIRLEETPARDGQMTGRQTDRQADRFAVAIAAVVIASSADALQK